ncbi:EamA family transporter RarD [Erythrobacter sp. EC-HK427]|uniref:EamA family transporter RarD n=1 Tax=Erythrobacter sp. EC-HK427 TaxID=2038396 RepID=UPI001256162F|nr:EamA family transporter RarD [Erythrobacter sp. EC-HK427]VVT12005.1 conserved membrane hypothetical protein [Erythrobacter sp. EC-HK427]
MTPAPATAETSQGQAFAYALTAYTIWGLLPLYLVLVKDVPAVEFVAWRTLFTLPVCLLLVLLMGRGAELRQVLRSGQVLRILFCTAALIAVNWLGYIWAVQNGFVFAASLGYYILPLVSMMIGVVLLKERLSAMQWSAVGLAAIGVSALAAGAPTTLWVSLLLAFSFGIYGLLRKTVAAGALVGLTVEAAILFPIVAGYLLWIESSTGTALGRDALETAAIIGAGVVTATPLLFFATAARALPYSVIGLMQFLAPTMMFVLGLTVFGEELRLAQLISFIVIWSAVALFSWDLFRKSRKPAQPA